MAFSVVVFVAALWALSTEMVEDSVVNLIYGHIFGWGTLVKSLLTASVILVSVSVLLVFYASNYLQSYEPPIKKGSGRSVEHHWRVLAQPFNPRSSR